MKQATYQRKNKKGEVVGFGIKTVNELPSKTKQSFRDIVNTNNIIKKYRQTGIINHITSKDGVYGDFSEMKDFSGALNTVIKAKQQFELLPSEVRNRFGNDPSQLISFLQDPKNVDESVRLGLRTKKTTSPGEVPPKQSEGGT